MKSNSVMMRVNDSKKLARKWKRTSVYAVAERGETVLEQTIGETRANAGFTGGRKGEIT